MSRRLGVVAAVVLILAGLAAVRVVRDSRRVVGPRLPRAAAPLQSASGRRVPLATSGAARIEIPITDRVPPHLPADGVPAGWDLREFVGRADVDLVPGETGVAVRLRSEWTSFALSRDVVIDPRQLPRVSWSWRVTALPTDEGGGPEMAPTPPSARDAPAKPGRPSNSRFSADQGAQVYVIFPRWPSPLTRSRVIGYVWDSREPVGAKFTSPKAANVKLVVVESGTEHVGAWRHEERDVVADYTALFGGPAPRIGRVAVMADTATTGGRAEVEVADLAFSRAAPDRTKMPTSMLR